jgi:hypothetical protein
MKVNDIIYESDEAHREKVKKMMDTMDRERERAAQMKAKRKEREEQERPERERRAKAHKEKMIKQQNRLDTIAKGHNDYETFEQAVEREMGEKVSNNYGLMQSTWHKIHPMGDEETKDYYTGWANSHSDLARKTGGWTGD